MPLQNSAISNHNKRLSILPFYFSVLLVTSFFDQYITIMSLSVKLFYIFCIPLIFLFVLLLFKRKIRFSKFDYAVLLWILSSLFAIGHYISTSDVITCVIGEVVLFAIYKTFSFYIKSGTIKRGFAISLFFDTIFWASVYGIVQFFLYTIFGITYGINHIATLGFPRPQSIFSEPDWLGYQAMCGFLYFFVLHYCYHPKDVVSFFKFFICGIAMILSFARAAWVGAAICVILFLMFFPNRKAKLYLIKDIIFIVLLLMPVVFVLYQTSPRATAIINRLTVSNWNENDGGAAGSRLSSLNVMFYFIKLHVFTGNGSGSMNYISNNPELLASLGINYSINAGRGNANLFVTNLFDVGIVGSIFLVSYLVLIFKKLFRNFSLKNINSSTKCLMLVFVGALIDFQFNNGIRLASFWILIALINTSVKGKSNSKALNYSKNKDARLSVKTI